MCVRVWVWVLLCLRAHYMLHTDYFSFFFLKWGLRQESLVRMFLTHITHKRCRTELNCTIFMCPVLGALSYFWGSVDACSSTTHWAAVIFHSFFFWVHVTDVFATVSTSHHFILFPEYLLRTSLQLSRPLRCVLTPLASAPISSASCGACSQTTPCLQMPDVACASVRRCLCECQTLPVRMPDVACANARRCLCEFQTLPVRVPDVACANARRCLCCCLFFCCALSRGESGWMIVWMWDHATYGSPEKV